MPAKYDSAMSGRRYGVVIPCFNEEENLENLIKACEAVLAKNDFEFVLVNNGSSDNSQRILNNLNHPQIRALNLETNMGYGGGILAGLRILETEYVGWIHADLQTDLTKSLSDLDAMHFDFFKGTRTGRSFSERIFSAGMGVICSIIFRTKLYEINAQPTIMKRSLFTSWENPPSDFSLDLYAFLIAKKRNAVIARSEYFFAKRTYGHSAWNFGIRSRLGMISRTLRYAHQLAKSGMK